jgi:O-antigen/teichoic acid export membrane protein
MSFSLFAACGLTLCAGLSLFSPEIVHVIAAPRFHGAAALIGPVSAAMLIMATTMFAPGLEIECKTSWIAGTGLTSGAVNLLLCWLWVPRFGAMGAASAMCCSATLQMLVIFSLSQRNYRVPHRWGRLVAATLLTALVTRSGPGAMIVGLDLDHWAARGALLGGLAVACWLLLVQPFVQTSIRSHFLHGNSAH